MKIHHLNCGTMCPMCQRLVNGHGSWTKPGRMVCHCLLVETASSLVLVDTGMGSQDILHPAKQLGRAFVSITRPQLSMAETAIAQIRRLGYDPKDVRHILPTHLDLDHAGGLADFPHAKVHVYKPELEQITRPTLRDKVRFRAAQFAHHPHWVVHEAMDEPWFGFNSTVAIPALDVDIRIVPLIGHTKGHAGIAVQDKDKWLLHCGDAYFHHSQVTKEGPMSIGLAVFERLAQTYPEARANHVAKLRHLAQSQQDQVEMFCAHDLVEYERYGKRVG